MENQNNTSVVFDYTNFLGASCKKKWTVYEIFTSIAPIFATAWKSNVEEAQEPSDKLWEQAFNCLSAQSSDEANLISLVNLAKDQGIDELKLMMPYELDQEQIKIITDTTQVQIQHTAQDEFTIKM